MMVFRWINKQAGIKQSFEIYGDNINIIMTEYHHWINRQTYMVYSNTAAVYGEMRMVNPVVFSIYTSLKHLKCISIQGFNSYKNDLIKDTSSMNEHAALETPVKKKKKKHS